MKQIGDIKLATEIGFKGNHKYMWHACIDCGKERWVSIIKGKAKDLRCISCAVKSHKPNAWKGGRVATMQGYILITLKPDNFFYPMRQSRGYVFEHRLVMAKHLGRNLLPWEIVHHKTGAKDDNRIENLQLVSDDRHRQITVLECKIQRLEKRLGLLKTKNALLKWEVINDRV